MKGETLELPFWQGLGSKNSILGANHIHPKLPFKRTEISINSAQLFFFPGLEDITVSLVEHQMKNCI